MSSQIDSLSSQFNSLLTQYQETYQQFLNVINSADISNNLMTVPNSSFIGQSNINTTQNTTLDNCVTSCTSTSSCSGATFDSQLNTCILSSGKGTIQSSPNKTAIIRQALYYSNQLQNLNQQLLNLNNQIKNNADKNINIYNTNTKTINDKAQILQNNYSVLEEERVEINEIIRQTETLNAALENGNINVTSNYYVYILLIIAAIFLIFIMFKYSGKSEQKGGGHLKFNINLLFMFILLGLIIIFNSYIKIN